MQIASHRLSGRHWPRRRATGLSLIELLVVMAILSLLVTITVPSLSAARSQARRAVCAVNLRGLNQAFMLYLSCNDMKYFPYRETVAEGTLWYWGLELPGVAVEGSRQIDIERARLATYFYADRKVQVCPEAVYASPFKPKFNLAGYGYAINTGMLEGCGQATVSFDLITAPSETIAWADSMQVNTWTPPASSTNPMLEDWYYLENKVNSPATFHFRHLKTCNAVFADGGVRPIRPYWLDESCDGEVGRPEAPVHTSQAPDSPLLMLIK